MNTNIFANSKVRKVALGVAGLAFVGGVTAGPAITASFDEGARSMAPVAAVAAEKPSMETLVPDGVQGAQQSVDWNDEQVAALWSWCCYQNDWPMSQARAHPVWVHPWPPSRSWQEHFFHQSQSFTLFEEIK